MGRLNDYELWATNIAVLIDLFWAHSGYEKRSSVSRITEVAELDLPCASVRDCMRTPEARQALLNLDIVESDHDHLHDILDPDNGGTIGVLDLMDGLARLRGEPRRSDTISIDLMVRSLQQQVVEVQEGIKKLAKGKKKYNPQFDSHALSNKT